MGRLFGTDGVRGLANGDLTAELALDLAVAAAHVLGDAGAFAGHDGRPVAVVGPGPARQRRVPRGRGRRRAGRRAGVDVVRVGVLPTPAVAYLTAALDADLGVMLSASHNPMPDNGIKFFARGGHKLPDDVEDAIEARIARGRGTRPTGARRRPRHATTPRAPETVRRAPARDARRTASTGLRVVVDCANGAAVERRPRGAARAPAPRSS